MRKAFFRSMLQFFLMRDTQCELSDAGSQWGREGRAEESERFSEGQFSPQRTGAAVRCGSPRLGVGGSSDNPGVQTVL